MKFLVKETIEHYHVIDVDDDYSAEEFINDLSGINPREGMDAVKEILESLCVEFKIQENQAGEETTSIEIIDEYDEWGDYLELTLYTIGCPKCNILKKKLDLAQIEYKICDDVETIRNKGYTVLPILEIDNTPYEFGNAVKWVNERINNEH